MMNCRHKNSPARWNPSIDDLGHTQREDCDWIRAIPSNGRRGHCQGHGPCLAGGAWFQMCGNGAGDRSSDREPGGNWMPDPPLKERQKKWSWKKQWCKKKTPGLQKNRYYIWGIYEMGPHRQKKKPKYHNKMLASWSVWLGKNQYFKEWDINSILIFIIS